MNIRPALTTLSIAGLLALTGCGLLDGDGDDATPDASPDATPEPAEDTEGEAEGGAEETAEEPSEDPEDPEGAGEDMSLDIADAQYTVTYPIQGDAAEGEITMGLHSLEVDDQGMLLTVSFIPEYEDENAVHRFRTLHGHDAGSVLLPVINDRQNFTAYHVPRQTSNQFAQGGGWLSGAFGQGAWASAIGDVEVQSGEQVTHWAYFPAPVDDVDIVDVAVIPGVQEFEGVEIQR
ncbi:hypothetical protein [Nesterenkonia sp. HG001]|uniref:hypothetical protein n=1 Tax=Nesterenkonia sp. HG001 TaxID=2983207 RepID=UPI002AC45C9F|nr:hypothetical protein [Nesterenkonia sp. HG001]MDZ5078789.1 hypothetical protein [Nesterenkonia sp. HG001]